MSTSETMSGARSRQPVITIRLGGGLGNQLFQYAFGRRMALANNAKLCLDGTGYENIALSDPQRGVRAMGLDHFNIVGEILQRRTDATPAKSWLRRKIRKYWIRWTNLLETRKPYYLRRDVYEAEDKHFTFDPLIYHRKIREDVAFYGYWQTEKYFLEIEQILRQELVVKDPLRGQNEDLSKAIQSTSSVSIHVRHGDNANAVAPALGVLPAEYFERCVSQLAKEVPEPHFFVFSEDIPWAKELLTLEYPTTFVSHNGDARNYEDLRLMSLCRHHILGNSTFSWWGAWLSAKPCQIVFAPRRYYQNIDRPNPDLFPERWRLI